MEMSEFKSLSKNVMGALLTLTFSLPAIAVSIDSKFNYEGKIYDASTGEPVSSSSAVFRVEIWNPSSSCKLYDASKTVDLSHSNDASLYGTFAFSVGDGSFTRRPGDPNHSLAHIFSNKMSLPGYSSCSYSPDPGHSRVMKVWMDQDGAGSTHSDELIASHILGSSPTASVAESLQGYVPSDFFKKSEFSCSANEILQFTGSSWACAPLPASGAGTVTSITAGVGMLSTPSNPLTTTGTLSVNVGTSANQIVQLDSSGRLPALDGSLLTGVSSSLPDITTAGTYTRVTVDTKGRVTAGAALESADLPAIDASKITSGEIDDARMPTKLSVTGGIMTGPLNMNGQKISNVPDPLTNSDVANRNYVDNAITSLPGVYLLKDGSLPMSGNLDLDGHIIENAQVVNTGKLKLQDNALGGTDPNTIENDNMGLYYTNSWNQRAPIPWVANPGFNEYLMWSGSGWITSPGGGGGGVSSLNVNSPLMNSGTVADPIVSLNYGAGLTVLGSSLEAKSGNGIVVDGNGINVLTGSMAGAVMAADAVPSCASNQKLQMNMGPFFNWSCVFEEGDITEITAGTGLSGGGTNGSVMLSVNFGTAPGTAAEGNDPRFGNADRLQGYAVSGGSPANFNVLMYGAGEWMPYSIVDAISGSFSPLVIRSTMTNSTRGITSIQTSTNTGDSAALNLIRTRGSAGAEASAQGNDILGGIYFRGWDNVGYTGESAKIVAVATGSYNVSNQPARLEFHTTASGKNSIERMRITQEGNVGISTNSPANKLHVSTNSGPSLRLDSTGASSGLEIYSESGTVFDPSFRLLSYFNGPAGTVFDHNPTDSNTELFLKSGAVGINMTNPQASLDVKGDVQVDGHIKIKNIAGLGVSCTGAPTINFSGSNDVRGTVDFSGGVASASCTITFQAPYSGAPTCVVSWATNAAPPNASIGIINANPNSIIVGFSSSQLSGKFNYICLN